MVNIYYTTIANIYNYYSCTLGLSLHLYDTSYINEYTSFFDKKVNNAKGNGLVVDGDFRRDFPDGSVTAACGLVRVGTERNHCCCVRDVRDQAAVSRRQKQTNASSSLLPPIIRKREGIALGYRRVV